MAQRRFLSLYRGHLLGMGLSLSKAEATSYNTIRRFMPTLAGVLNLDPAGCQSIGNLTDIPGGLGHRAARPTHPMSRQYAADKMTTAMLDKRKAVVAVHLAIAKRSLQDLSAMRDKSSYWREGPVTWDSLSARNTH